jgi:hypothetical protein
MLYNTLNSAVDLQGERFFYCNPVTWDGTEGVKIKQTNGRDRERLVPGHQSGGSNPPALPEGSWAGC